MSPANQEILVLNALKYFQTEYREGVPVNILKLELDLSDEELKEILSVLDGKGTVLIHDERVKLVQKDLVGEDQEETVVEEISEEVSEKIESDTPKENINTKNLTEDELKAYHIIKKQTNASGEISRTLLEGHLLYDDLKLSTLGCYKMVASLENKGVIRKINNVNGEYFVI
jgi:hypothetical protein